MKMIRNGFIDFVLVTGLLIAVNVFTTPQDLGWFKLNPCPYLIVPLLIGGRFGSRQGFIAGLLLSVASLGVITCQQLISNDIALTATAIGEEAALIIRALRPELMNYWLAMPLIGIVAGRAHSYFKKNAEKHEKENQEIKLRAERLQAELDLTTESRHDLEQRLSLHGAEFVAIDTELHGLFAPNSGPLFPNVLRILEEICSVQSSALYVFSSEGMWTCEASNGADDFFPEQLDLNRFPMAKAAIDNKKLTTCRELWADTPERGELIAVVPWQNSAGIPFAVLVIRHMPFMALNWQNIARIELICRWVGILCEFKASPESSPEGQAGGSLVEPSEFLRSLDLALETSRSQQTPSGLARFSVKEAEGAKALEEVLVPSLKSSDVATKVDENDYLVLMPMRGIREAGELVQTVVEKKAIPGIQHGTTLVAEGEPEFEAVHHKLKTTLNGAA